MKFGRRNKCIKCQRRYMESRSEINAENQRRWYSKNREEHKERSRKWKKDNPDRVKKYINSRRSVEYEPYKLRVRCGYCGSRKNLTLDHVIPIKFIEWYDIDTHIVSSKYNYETACVRCNAGKNARIPLTDEHLERIENLLGYDIREKILMKHCWIPPISRLKLFNTNGY